MSEPGFTPYEPNPDLPVSRSPRPAAPGHVVGRVDGAQTRLEGHGDRFGSETVLSFRLVEMGSMRPLDVELRGTSLSGTVRDGDWVEVADRVSSSGRLEVPRLTNLSTGSAVTTRGGTTGPAGKIVLAVFLVVFVLFMLIFGYVAYSMYTSWDTPF